MKKIIIAAVCLSGAAYGMDKPDIDMMILKRAGIAKLEEALQNKKAPAFVGPYSTTNEPYFIETRAIISIDSEIVDFTAQDPLICAIMSQIKLIESHDGGYFPQGSYDRLANNRLGFITRYWHEKRPDGTPYIRYRTECNDHETRYIEKALQELRAANKQ